MNFKMFVLFNFETNVVLMKTAVYPDRNIHLVLLLSLVDVAKHLTFLLLHMKKRFYTLVEASRVLGIKGLLRDNHKIELFE